MAAGKTFVLIAGAWHGAWCWKHLVPLLEAAGHRVVTPELPGTGADTTDPGTVTLDSWAEFVLDRLADFSAPVLVGHSRAGAVISRAAELAPERVGRLVYLAAYLLGRGQSVAEAARADADSLAGPNMLPAASGVTCTLRPAVVRAAFYGCCSEEDITFARERLGPEPLKPLAAPLRITEARFGRIPRVYVETTLDRTLTLQAQRRMQAALPCESVHSLATDHSPFFSMPRELAQVLGGL